VQAGNLGKHPIECRNQPGWIVLMDALKKSLASEAASPKNKKPRKVSASQKEMLLPIEGKKPVAKKSAKPERATKRKAG
jgi:DNA end-binding protein Ku